MNRYYFRSTIYNPYKILVNIYLFICLNTLFSFKNVEKSNKREKKSKILLLDFLYCLSSLVSG